MRLGGIYDMKIQLVHLEIVKDQEVDLGMIRSQDDAFRAAKLMIGKRANENMLILCLDTKSNIIGATIAAAGSVDCVIVRLREIFKYAIICNATSIVVAHNHPSGFLAPSDDDINITRQIIAAGQLLGINVFDHIIVTGDNYLSLADTTDLFRDRSRCK